MSPQSEYEINRLRKGKSTDLGLTISNRITPNLIDEQPPPINLNNSPRLAPEYHSDDSESSISSHLDSPIIRDSSPDERYRRSVVEPPMTRSRGRTIRAIRGGNFGAGRTRGRYMRGDAWSARGVRRGRGRGRTNKSTEEISTDQITENGIGGLAYSYTGSMNTILVWNCQGIGRALTIQNLGALIR